MASSAVTSTAASTTTTPVSPSLLFKRQGFVIVKGVLDKVALTALQQECDRLHKLMPAAADDDCALDMFADVEVCN